LLRIVLGDPQRLELLWEKQIAKSSRKGGEDDIFACRGGLVVDDIFMGLVAAA
jgi:hypothetical protein